MKKKEYNFGEKEYEKSSGKKIPVIQTSKYLLAKENVISLLESPEYKGVLNQSDFWILMNFNKDKTECYYSGLIISHDALLKVNDTLDEKSKFNEKFCSQPIPCSFKDIEILRMEYRDPRDGMFEVGEISVANCKNDYPFAMLLKRTFDRVVKRKAKLSNVYSDSEAEEFKEPTEVKKEPKAIDEQITKIISYKDVILDELMERQINRPSDVEKLTVTEASKLCKLIDERLEGVQ